MEIVAMSDLHLEFESSGVPRHPTRQWLALHEARRSEPGHPDVGPLLSHLAGQAIDLIIMAGDIDLDTRGIAYAEAVSRYLDAPVIYVIGNHEGYRCRDLDLLIEQVRTVAIASSGRVIFLENESAVVETGGQRMHVLGCSLFTDYALNGDTRLAIVEARASLNDHRLMRLGGGVFTPELARARHDASRQWLDREVSRIRAEEGDAATIVIVTHHAPVPEANPPQYRGGSLSPAFASDLRLEIDRWRPTLWVWGHTHHSMDMMRERTRLLSSQRGYVCNEAGADEYRPTIVSV